MDVNFTDKRDADIVTFFDQFPPNERTFVAKMIIRQYVRGASSVSLVPASKQKIKPIEEKIEVPEAIPIATLKENLSSDESHRLSSKLKGLFK